jgi:hypothetical protein
MSAAAIGKPEPTIDQPPCQRRRIPLSLMMFVAINLLAFVICALWVGVPAYRQYIIIREIDRLGGTVDGGCAWPNWLLRRVGDSRMRMFDEIVNVRLADTQATDDTLRRISGLTKLSWLDLNNTRITDSGLAHLKSQTSLKWLMIEDTRVTDAGLAHLHGLHSLELIQLGNTRVTKAGVDKLVQATGLMFIGNGPF